MKIQVLITREDEWLVAEMLQKYFVIQARDIEQLLQEFLRTLRAHKTLDTLDGLDTAELSVWHEYENAEPFVYDEQILARAREEFELPEIEFRQR